MTIMDISLQLRTPIKDGSQGQYLSTGMILFLKPQYPDPPLFLARLFDAMLDSAGITVSGSPSTGRLINKNV